MIPDPDLIFVALYVILNIMSLALFGADKRKARREQYRIRESTLLISGFFGPFGALAGIKLFRHKTKKRKFKVIYLFLILHLILIFIILRQFWF